MLMLALFAASSLANNGFKTIPISTSDGLTITADIYELEDSQAPVILLFHQARFSRGEYREIAPKLNALGFTCIAIDQRSGGQVNGVENDLFSEAEKNGKGTTYADAYPDLKYTLQYARKAYPDQKIIVWGSSYSASLVLVLAAHYPEIVSGALAFSPGNYFEFDDKSVTEFAKTVNCPVFLTSSREEAPSRQDIFKSLAAKQKTFFIPEGEGYHGSKALWSANAGNEEYWTAVEAFLKPMH